MLYCIAQIHNGNNNRNPLGLSVFNVTQCTAEAAGISLHELPSQWPSLNTEYQPLLGARYAEYTDYTKMLPHRVNTVFTRRTVCLWGWRSSPFLDAVEVEDVEAALTAPHRRHDPDHVTAHHALVFLLRQLFNQTPCRGRDQRFRRWQQILRFHPQSFIQNFLLVCPLVHWQTHQ